MERINVADRMRELIKTLREDGIDGVRFSDISPECEGGWGEDYAIAQDAYSPDVSLLSDYEYFDHGRLMSDFKEFVRRWFSGDETLTVKIYSRYESNEVEVYRAEEQPPPEAAPEVVADKYGLPDLIMGIIGGERTSEEIMDVISSIHSVYCLECGSRYGFSCRCMRDR